MRKRTRLNPAIATAVLLLMAGAPIAHAEKIANKFVFTSHLGWDVNQTTGGSICTLASGDTCQLGTESSQPGGFNYPESVAVDDDPSSVYYTDVYVADHNHRVQMLSATGAFVSMFGWEVNKTKDETPGSTQAEKNVCTAESHDECQAGVRGAASGQIAEGFSIAIDETDGNVYLAERVLGEAGGEAAFDYRVQEFTDAGAWLAEIGREVNQTTGQNLCTEHEVEAHSVQCQGPVLIPGSSDHSNTEQGSFNLAVLRGNILAVGGPKDLLYVGDEHRVQEFDAVTGEAKGEISLASISAEPNSMVTALAVDVAGDVYLAYESAIQVIREFNPNGVQSAEFEVTPGEANPQRIEFSIRTLALDPYGRLGVTTDETIEPAEGAKKSYTRGALYSAAGVRIGEFATPSGSLSGEANGLAFSASDGLYVAGGFSQEVEAYVPALFPEATTCAASEVSATGAVLCGQINANGLKARGFFAYAPPAGARTPVAFEGEGTAPEAVSTRVTGLEPNQTYEYETVAEAEIAGEEIAGHGERVSFHTATPPPEVPGEPSASDVTDAFAILNASVNPEHAAARYHFEYGPCAMLAGCAGVVDTTGQESSAYGTIGAIQEAVGLQPDRTYSYRLVANNTHEEPGHAIQGGETVGAEGHFTTGTSPVPVAQTGSASGVGATGATIAGLVDPDGQPAVYAFELGVYNGASTHYGIVFSGAAGAGTALTEETLPLSGLQPGTTYAYRIVLTSGYGESVGQTMIFTTQGLPTVLTVPSATPLLTVPPIAFPGEAKGGTTTVKKTTSKCKRGERLVRGKCVKTKAKARKRKAKKSAAHRAAKRK